MLGISWAEFLVIFLVAICVVPARNWPSVMRFFARIVKYIREIIWKISDFSEEIQRRIELEKPIDDLIVGGATDIFDKKFNKSKKSKRTRRATRKK